jgi:hypothetical protein
MTAHPVPFAVKNPLTAKLNRGMAKPDAVRKAEENLSGIKEKTLAELDVAFAEMQALATELARAPSTTGQDALYRLSNKVAGIAGTFGREALGEAAFCLCDLLDRTSVTARWPAETIAVHLEGMKILRHVTSSDEKTVEAILCGLYSVVNHVAPKPEL